MPWPVYKYAPPPSIDQTVNELQDVVDIDSVQDTQEVINDKALKRGEQLDREIHAVDSVRHITNRVDSSIHNLTDNILAR